MTIEYWSSHLLWFNWWFWQVEVSYLLSTTVGILSVFGCPPTSFLESFLWVRHLGLRFMIINNSGSLTVDLQIHSLVFYKQEEKCALPKRGAKNFSNLHQWGTHNESRFYKGAHQGEFYSAKPGLHSSTFLQKGTPYINVCFFKDPSAHKKNIKKNNNSSFT